MPYTTSLSPITLLTSPKGRYPECARAVTVGQKMTGPSEKFSYYIFWCLPLKVGNTKNVFLFLRHPHELLLLDCMNLKEMLLENEGVIPSTRAQQGFGR